MRIQTGTPGRGKRVFAGKQCLRAEPFCPFTTDKHGYLDLFRQNGRPASSHMAAHGAGVFPLVADASTQNAKARHRTW